MTPERILPDDPLGFIQQCVQQRKIRWTYHVNMRLQGRTIPRQVILESVPVFEIIEAYPEDKYLPSYLVYSQHQGVVFHVLCAVDVPGDNIRIVTAYYPNPEEWEADLKTRRRSL
jgi:hypothetical protein